MTAGIIVFSGSIATGKTTVAAALSHALGGTHIRTRDLLLERSKGRVSAERLALQRYGENLDKRTHGRWLADQLGPLVAGSAEDLLIVDSVRLQVQVEAMRQSFSRLVTHVHLTAPERVLAERFRARVASGILEAGSFEAAKANKTEAQVSQLQREADLVLDTEQNRTEDIVARIIGHLRQDLNSPACVDVLIGGQYGSEGKGNIAFYLAPEYQVLVRVGGPNAGHKVPLDTPITHRMLPSGTMAAANAQLVIGPGAVLDVGKLLEEIAQCEVERSRLAIDPQAMIISDADKKSELRLKAEIGSTGSGTGAATSRRVMRRKNVKLAASVAALRPYLRSSLEVYAQAYARGDRILLEGTQGTALSMYHGYYPHVTSRDTTASGCLAEAGLPPSRLRRVVMVCRTYPIRVQDPSGSTSGPMSREIFKEDISRRSGVSLKELEGVERGSVSNRPRRFGEFDWQLLRKSSLLNAPTDIALTFADYLRVENRSARRFEQLTPETIRFIEEVEKVSAANVSLISVRFHTRGIIDRRHW